MKKSKGFTLIELLAVIVIIGIILAIAIPTITGIINSTTKNAFEVDAKMVLKAINYKKMEDEDFDITSIDETNIKSLLGVSDDNYISVEITNENNIPTVVIVGKNKWADLVAYGTIKSITIENAEDYNGDITKPVITMLGSTPVSINAGSVYNDAGATALDDTDGNITANITATSTVNVNVAGTYTVTYNVSDAACNVAIPVVRTVNVVAVLATITTTDPATNITTSGATISGNVTSDGGSAITERGIVYGTSANPTISGSKVVVAGTTGAFSGNITGLTNGATYHVRAYATNSAGTNYGANITFTTLMGGIDQYTKLMLHMDGADNGTTFTDEAGKTVTRVGNTVTKTGTKVFGTASGYLDGAGDYLTLTNSADWYFGTGDFTIDFWVKFSGYDSGGYNTLVGKYVDTSNWFYITYRQSPQLIQTYCVSSGTYRHNYYASWNPTLNTWYHLAFVRNGSNFYIFINGVSQAITVATAFNGNIDFTNGVNIGAADSTSYFVSGYMDEVRISKGIARWTSNFTPPSAPYSE